MTSSPDALQRIDFGPVSIAYDTSVLVPRAWTLEQSEWVRDLVADQPEGPVLELCAGAGHLGLAAVHGTDRPLVQVDADEHACELARINAAANGIDAEVRHGRLEEVVQPQERFVAVLADPPWVRTADVGRFPEDPRWAIDGGPDGIDVALACLDVAARHLRPGGWLVIQLGDEAQARLLADTAPSHGLAMRECRTRERGALAAFRR